MAEPPALTSEQIEPALRAALPPAEQHRAAELARALLALIGGDVSHLGGLAGREVPVAGGLISFGSGNQFGDVIFKGDIAGGHIIRVTLNLPPPPPPPAFQVPYPLNPLFRGRDAELAELERALLSGDAGTVAVLPALSGTGGIGKTQLASEFAHRQRDQFPGGIFWVSMEQPDQVASQVAACAGTGGLNLPGWAEMSFEERLAAVRHAWTAPVCRLLVFDNLEEPRLLAEWRPVGGEARVLITTRRGTWARSSGVQAVPLPTLARPESVRLLLAPRYGDQVETQLADSTTAQEVDAIAETVGDLPLALALAGAYLEQTPSLSLAGYRARLGEALLAHPSLDADLDEGLPTQHAASVAATIALSYDQIALAPVPVRGVGTWLRRLLGVTPKPDSALTLLQRLAQFAPAPIPQRLLVRLIDCDPDDEAQAAKVDASLRRLVTVGLIERLSEGEAVLHRLVAAFVRGQDGDAAASVGHAADRLIKEVAAINRAGYPLRGQPYLVHLRGLAARAAHMEAGQAATLLLNLGYLLKAQGDLTGARSLYERALAMRERTLGPTHPDTASSLNNLASLLQAQGDLAGARPILERALAMREQALGPTHPDTALSLNNLASLLQDQGDVAGARPLYERALAIWEQALGPTHPATASSLNNLASLLQDQGDLAGARPLYERALAMREQALGPTHPDTASSLNNLAGLLKAQGDLAGARPLYERALVMTERALGPTHPDTASSLNNLAGLLKAQGDLAGARPLYERALAMREQALGPTHPDTASSLSNLASLLQAQGDLVGARPLLERALTITERALGPTHPATASSLNNLAGLLQAQGDLAGARPLYERALAIWEQALGPTHPDTALSLNNLASLLQAQGDLAGARPLYERALAIWEQALGPTHPNTQQVRANLAAIDAAEHDAKD
ncbi:tetratricopeptide repeat protein [Chloroflexales bacterium ZM16-3]|nr:tetratricopeptide repeat protein [Chloroflexales bacterium ZM16-3]